MTNTVPVRRQLPTAEQLREIQGLLGTLKEERGATADVAARTPAPLPWDGAADQDGVVSAEAAKKRTLFVQEMTSALDKHLTVKLRNLAARKTAPRLPMTKFEGPGRAAKAVVDEAFSGWTNQAALTGAQLALRRREPPFEGAGAGQNLLEVTDAGDRERGKQPINPWDVLKWMADSDPNCQKAASDHHFNRHRLDSKGRFLEASFLETAILRPFLEADEQRLHEYDRLGFGMTNPDTGLVFINGSVEGWPQGGSEGDEVVRLRKWAVFKTLVHEYIHTLQHPNIPAATDGNMVVKEGFCQLLTEIVLRPLLAKTQVERRRKLAAEIEGGTYPALDDALIARYDTPEDYLAYFDKAYKIEKIIGDEALLAVYLQGHVELLGLSMIGNPLPPVGPLATVLPRDIKILSDLARRTGLSEHQISTANPTSPLTAALPEALVLPGFHSHEVVFTRDTTTEDETITTETWDQIAAQHGTSVALLHKYNPTSAGQHPEPSEVLLIPDRNV